MNLGQRGCAIRLSNVGDTLHFAPVAEAVFSPERCYFPDTVALVDGFNRAYPVVTHTSLDVALVPALGLLQVVRVGDNRIGTVSTLPI